MTMSRAVSVSAATAMAIMLSLSCASAVTVTILGPDEGYYDKILNYGVDMAPFEVDGDTLKEMRDNDGHLAAWYTWSYAPAVLTHGVADGAGLGISIKYGYDHAGTYQTLSVTVTSMIIFPDGSSLTLKSGSGSKTVLVKKPTVAMQPEQTHDYIVPGCSLNTLQYELAPNDVSSVLGETTIIVKDSSGRSVRTLNASTSGGTHLLQWDGRDDAGNALTERDSPYRYVLWATDRSGHEFTSELGGRLVKEWNVSIIVRDRSVPPAEYESGVAEETIAGEDGAPQSLSVRVNLFPGGFDVSNYGITADTGLNGWDAAVLLRDEHAVPCLFYTTPNPEVLPAIRYEMVLSQTDPFVQDASGNAWDIDPEQDGQQTSAKWTFGISPDGELREWEEEYN